MQKQVAEQERIMAESAQDIQELYNTGQWDVFPSNIPYSNKNKLLTTLRNAQKARDALLANPPQKGSPYDPIGWLPSEEPPKPPEGTGISDFENYMAETMGIILQNQEEIEEALQIYGAQYEDDRRYGDWGRQKFTYGATQMADIIDQTGISRALMYSAMSPQSMGGIIPDEWMGTYQEIEPRRRTDIDPHMIVTGKHRK